jgi:hypothetical protein
VASSSSGTTPRRPGGAATEPIAPALDPETVNRWISQGMGEGVKPEQALAVIGLGLMRRLAGAGQETGWVWSDDDEGSLTDLTLLRQRLELTRLAIDTGAPLSTAEVSQLLGARPGGPVVQRGGLTARRLGRNVWKLSRSSDEAERGGGGFSESFRRRL